MFLNEVKITFYLKNRLLPDDEEIEILKNSIEKYVYPIGMCTPIQFINAEDQYLQFSTEENYIYMNNFITKLFNAYYTNDELTILSIYVLLLLYRGKFFLNNTLSIIPSLLFIHSEKTDVEYCLNTIRYHKLTSLMHTQSTPENNSLALRLISELEDIEDEYNNMQLGAFKDEYTSL